MTTKHEDLQLEFNNRCTDRTIRQQVGDKEVIVSPRITPDYWLFRVAVSERQAIVGFPKFGMIGIGFQYETDWNTNLPSANDAAAIFEHIKHNKGDDAIEDARCVAAIEMVQTAARAIDMIHKLLNLASIDTLDLTPPTRH